MNKNPNRSLYESGEIVFGIQSPGVAWVKLDGTTQKINSKIASKLITIAWNTQTSNFGNSTISSAAYGNGIWVAGGGGVALRTSTDTINWNTQTSQFGSSLIFSVAYGNGTWVAVGSRDRNSGCR